MSNSTINENDNQKIFDSGLVCVDKEIRCHKFVIHNSESDGICCVYGQGYYKVHYGGDVLFGCSFDTKSKEHFLAGDGCPSLTPSISFAPSISSYTPSESPALSPSSAPTVMPSLSQSPSKFSKPTSTKHGRLPTNFVMVVSKLFELIF